MTNTTKLILIGAGVLVGGVVIASKVMASREAAAKPTGLAAVVAGVTQVVNGISTRSLSTGGTPYGTRASSPDGYVAIADADGYRARKALVPTGEVYLTDSQSRLMGLY